MRRELLTLGCVAALTLLTACGTEDSSVGSPGAKATTGKLRIVMHDAPTPAVDEVWVEFDEVKANHATQGWQVVSTATKSFDLLKLQNGLVEELGLATLPTGDYDQVRLHLTRAWVIVGGVKADLNVPSGTVSGLKINSAFTIPECGTVTMTLDWDVGAHLVNNKGQGWILRPTIKVESVTTDEGSCSCDFAATTRLPDMPLSLNVLGSTIAANGKIYIFGGTSTLGIGNWSYYRNVWEYDIVAGSFTDLGPILPYGMNIKSWNLTRADNGKYYTGPVIGTNQNGGWGGHNRVVEFDPATGTARERASFGGTIWDLVAANGGDGNVYFFGGWNGGSVPNIWRYNPTTDVITVVAALPVPGNLIYGATLASNGLIYVSSSQSKYVVFNPQTLAVSTIPQPCSSIGPTLWEAPAGTIRGFCGGTSVASLDVATQTASVTTFSQHLFEGAHSDALSVDYQTRTLYRFGGQNTTSRVLPNVYRVNCLEP